MDKTEQTVLRNGLVFLPSGLKKMDIHIKDGKIFRLAEKIELSGIEGGEIDLTGMQILPGLIDAHVHLREPGLEDKEDFASGTMAAAAGGVTTVLEMPNTIPATTTPQLVREKQALANQKAVVNVGLYALGVPETIDDILQMNEIVGIKIYLGASTGGHEADYDFLDYVLARSGDKVIVVHAEDSGCLHKNQQSFSEDEHDAPIHSKIRSVECAYLAVKKACELAEKHDARLHIAHITSKKELEVVAKYKTEKITCEATPHHLFLDTSSYFTLGNKIKVNPPIRAKEDVETLWKAIAEGLIDIVATDHAPHTLAEKTQDYDHVPSGVPGLETMLPLLMNEVNKGNLSLEKLVSLTSSRPAQIFGLTTKGAIKEGYDADLVVLDSQKIKIVNNADLYTKCKWSPFEGWKLQGWPIISFVGGKPIFRA